MKKPLIIFIVGPTAVGKSGLGYCLAQKMGGEIVSCDAMQVYKEVQIASNKPSSEERERVPHHLIDVVSVYDSFDVARFNKLALAAIKDILGRRKTPVVVGGSGMYVKILLDGIFTGAEKSERIRNRLTLQVQKKGLPALYADLKQKDPHAASKIHPNDEKRIIRALEVFLAEGQPISKLQRQRQGLWGHYDIRLYGLDMDRSALYEKINLRVGQMFEQGLIEEVKSLRWEQVSRTAAGLIGLSEVKGVIDGKYDEEKAQALMMQNTRRLAKRQWTWFRADKRICWLSVDNYANVKAMAGFILQDINKINEGQ